MPGTWGAGVFKTTNGERVVSEQYRSRAIFSFGRWQLTLQPNIVYAGNQPGKLYKSVNGGASWFLSSNGIQEGAIVYDI
jgi:hypothetical protein